MPRKKTTRPSGISRMYVNPGFVGVAVGSPVKGSSDAAEAPHAASNGSASPAQPSSKTLPKDAPVFVPGGSFAPTSGATAVAPAGGQSPGKTEAKDPKLEKHDKHHEKHDSKHQDKSDKHHDKAHDKNHDKHDSKKVRHTHSLFKNYHLQSLFRSFH
jgi:hypothetical protein